MKLFEIFQQPYEWKEEKFLPRLAFYSFTTGKEDYRVRIGDTQNPAEGFDVHFWKLAFRGDLASSPQEGITKTKNAFQVFATVIAIIKSFLLKRKDVEVLSFEAKERSRQDLYDRMIKTLAKEIGFSLEETAHAGKAKAYILHKNGEEK